jgi:membrane protein
MEDSPVPVGAAIPPPIPGRPMDPPPKEHARTLRKIDAKSEAAGAGYRAFLRFSYTNTTLLAAGTTYYAFLALFALVVFAFGIAALIGGEHLADTVTASLDKAFPGLIGDQGVSPSTLEQVGQTTSVIGLVSLLITGSGAMMALSKSLHLIYGVAKDPRNYVFARARLLAWMMLLVPLMGLSFVPSIVISNFATPVMDFLGLQGSVGTFLIFGLTAALALALNAIVIWFMLGHLGGVKPTRHALIIGTAIGAVGIEILKYLLSFIIAWSVGKPQYGAFAAPIAMLLVLWLEALVVYVAACVTAGIASVQADETAAAAVPIPA